MEMSFTPTSDPLQDLNMDHMHALQQQPQHPQQPQAQGHANEPFQAQLRQLSPQGDHAEGAYIDSANLSTLGAFSSADSIFWENNYIAQNIPALHAAAGAASTGHGHLDNGAVGVASLSPSSDTSSGAKRDNVDYDSSSNAANIGLSEQEIHARRKAQNRAAQRAFRERKESKLKELSEQLSRTEMEKSRLERELESLKKQNIVLSTENQVLMKNGSIRQRTSGQGPEAMCDSSQRATFPFDKSRFINDIIFDTQHDLSKAIKYDTLVYKKQGTSILTLGAVWDYLHKFSEDHEGLELDINYVMDSLKNREICDGYGPGYPVELVDKAIQESIQ